MARTISDEEHQLKRRARRRLIGAIVLVTAIIVVLPMVLDSEPRPASQSVSVQIPTPDSGVFTSKVVPLSAAPDSKPAPKAPDITPSPSVEGASKGATAPATQVAQASPKGTPRESPREMPKEAPKPAAQSEPDKAVSAAPAKGQAKKAPAKATKAAARRAMGQFVVQVIALADAERAKQMQGQISAAGIKSYTEVVKTVKGEVTRVRAGPFATRAAAEKALGQLKALGLSGNVTRK